MVLLLCLTAGCTGGDEAIPSPPNPPTNAENTPQADVDPATADSAADGNDADSSELCTGLIVAETGRVSSTGLSELSGLAASNTEPGLLWAHNDSGNEVVLHGLDETGAERAAVAVAVDAVDIEDIAISNGQVYLGDIGDNDRARSEVAVHVFNEPAPGDGAVGDVQTLRFRYPDRAHDAEALVVDPVDGTLVIITKEVGIGLGADDTLVVAAPAPMYTAAPPFATDGPIELQPAGTVALDELDRLATGQGPTEGLIAQVGGAGVATGADISFDASAVAIRTYETVWLFARADGQSLVEALAGEPCEVPTNPEPQGEAVAFLDGSSAAVVTVSEGTEPAVNVARTG